MKHSLSALVVAVLAVVPLHAQSLSVEEMSPDVSVPVFKARLSLGFNYDLLRPPTEVSFDYPKGYVGFNIPIQGNANPLDIAGAPVGDVFGDSSIFRNGEEFEPHAWASQSPNATFRVDVPMLGGVGSFSNIQNVAFSYLNTLGIPGATIGTSMEKEGIDLLMRAAVNVPLELSAKWETMTFGYAYKVNKNLVLAINLHRHLFAFDMKGKVSVDVLGYARIDQDVIKTEIPLEYSVGGTARANFSTESWSPTLAAKLWRLGLTARFGVDTRAKGEFTTKYEVPFFVDPQTFEIKMDAQSLMDPSYIGQLQESAVDSVTHSTSEDMVWKLPDGYTASFDIIRDKLSLSYTKTVGDLEMGLAGVWQQVKTNSAESGASGPESTAVNLDIAFTVDNVIMISGIFRNFFFNLGVFTLDFHTGQQRHILADALKDAGYPALGGAPIMPVLNFGSAMGTRMQLLLELDVLPLMALKTGIIYYF